MDRKDAPKEYKWNLCDIYKTHEDFEKDLEKVNEYLPIVEKFKGKLNNAETLLKYYKTAEAFGICNAKS